MPNLLSRRNVLTIAALSAGAVALLKGGLTPVPASAQNALPSGTVHSFSKKGRSVSHLCVTCANCKCNQSCVGTG